MIGWQQRDVLREHGEQSVQIADLGWTRDPFDRLLAAHSVARRSPLCSVDRDIRLNHAFLPPELALDRS
jgi:PIN domain nuclease of toxin-antitoxin system